ncbi:hypothetical protein D3C87_1618050 [compost metagenome]
MSLIVIFTAPEQLSVASFMSSGLPVGMSAALCRLATSAGAVPVGGVVSLTVII